LKAQGVFSPNPDLFLSPFFHDPIPGDPCAGMTLMG
jgi:hypothetical protein